MISYEEINRSWSKLPNELQKLMMYCAIDISTNDQEDKTIAISLDHIKNDIQSYSDKQTLNIIDQLYFEDYIYVNAESKSSTKLRWLLSYEYSVKRHCVKLYFSENSMNFLRQLSIKYGSDGLKQILVSESNCNVAYV